MSLYVSFSKLKAYPYSCFLSLKPVDGASIASPSAAVLCCSTVSVILNMKNSVLKKINGFGYEELYSLFFHLRHYAKSNSQNLPIPLSLHNTLTVVQWMGRGITLIAFAGEAQKGTTFI